MIRTIAVVPVRGRPVGKTRLSPLFDPARRAALVEAMAWHVVSTIQRTGVADRIVVVSEGTPFSFTSHRPASNLDYLVQPESEPGLNAALGYGRTWALANGADRLLVMSADLPLLEPADVYELADRRAPVVIAPDRFATGTNGLLLGGPRRTAGTIVESFEFQFGAVSFQHHLAEARRLGVPVDTASGPGTSFDLDTPDDWDRLPMDVHQRLLDPLLSALDPIRVSREGRQDWAESA